jgi:predicted Zn finger-like uncharacterized protein
MKFVCDQCKAKYQIADDKVAGKTVRMKCRKCGHMVEVRAAVTESSQATGEVEEFTDKPNGSPASGARTAAAAPVGASPRPPVPAAKPPAPAPKPSAPLATPLASVRPLAPKPGDKTPAPTAASRPALPAVGKGPSAPKGASGTLSAVRAPVAAEAPGALAGAFERSLESAVPEPEPPPGEGDRDSMSDAAGDEWYAAINGVPVGPIRLGEVRRKAAMGNINEDTLVWQEGMEEWRPVRALAELGELVREAAAIGRPSLLPPDGRSSLTGGGRPVSRGAAPPAMRGATPPAGTAAPGNMFFPASTSKGSIGPTPGKNEENTVMVPLAMLAPRASEEDLKNAPAAPAVEADPFAGMTPSPAPVAARPAFTNGGGRTEASFFPPAPEPQASASIAPEMVAGIPKPAKSAKAVGPLLMAGVAVVFGSVITLAVVGKNSGPAPKAETIVIYSSVPVTGPAPTPESSAAVAANGQKRTGGGGAPAAAGGAKPAASGGGADLSGLLGGNNRPMMPSVGGPGPGPGGGGGGLTQDQIEAVVASRRASVKRACLDRADPSVTNVKINVKATIGGNGLVQSASATGNDPTVARCVENNVKSWTFPASGGTSQLEIPFTLVRQ